jgi:hypothetical protein
MSKKIEEIFSDINVPGIRRVINGHELVEKEKLYIKILCKNDLLRG